MKKNFNEIQIINKLIQKHIETIKREEIARQDKELDYLLIQEAVESLVIEYKLSCDSRNKKHIMRTIIEVYNTLCAYLVGTNKYDYKILELYAMLDDLIYN